MTTDTNDHQTDFRPSNAQLTKEVLDQWRAEAREFISNTRRKLQQIREAEHAAPHSHAPTSLGRSDSEPRVIQESPSPALGATAVCELRDSPLLSLRAVDDAPAANPGTSPVADDSLDRLQAIKRRLAAQLENSRG